MSDQNQSAKDRRADRIYKVLRERGAVTRFAARKAFGLFERAGIHVTADHFYEIIPNTREIARDYNPDARPCTGIDYHFEAAEARMLAMLDRWAGDFYEEAAKDGYYEDNAYFRGADGLTLYCMIREHKPRRVIEIGHGFSTRAILAALRRNREEGGEKPSFLSVDPYARFVPEGPAAAAVDFQVHGAPLQESIPMVTGSLSDGDMLFVDSTHVFKFGSDVEVEFDHLYPNLPAGVHVHVHDIFSPFDYPKAWMVNARRFWNEQYHLENFLRFNESFKVTLPLHMLMRKSAPVLSAFKARLKGPDYLFTGQSFYFKRIK